MTKAAFHAITEAHKRCRLRPCRWPCGARVCDLWDRLLPFFRLVARKQMLELRFQPEPRLDRRQPEEAEQARTHARTAWTARTSCCTDANTARRARSHGSGATFFIQITDNFRSVFTAFLSRLRAAFWFSWMTETFSGGFGVISLTLARWLNNETWQNVWK